MPKFKYVRIPADINVPCTTEELDYTEDSKVGCMTELLQHYYRQNHPQNKDEAQQQSFLQQTVLKAFEDNARKTGQPVPALDSMEMERMSSLLGQMQMVDIIPLVNAKKETDFVSVGLYSDDTGVGKGLPPNARATGVTQAAGHPVRVIGDAFVARVRECDPDIFDRLDFTVEELREGSEFYAMAQKANADRDTRPGAPVSTEIAATEWKREGECWNTSCKQDGSMRCSRCGKARYCSKECQKAHWKTHKKISCSG